jgi:hypothetical protein
MKSLNLLKSYRENFSGRIFFSFSVFFLLVFLSFVAFFIRHEVLSIKKRFFQDGDLLAMVLAHNARVEIFSENKNIFEDQMEVVFQKPESMSVSVWSMEKRFFKHLERGKRPFKNKKEFDEAAMRAQENRFKTLMSGKAAFRIEEDKTLQFFSPIYSQPPHYVNEYANLSWIYSARLIGFVEVTMDKSMLNEEVRTLLAWATGIGVLLFLLGARATFILAKKATRPLKRLTEEVMAMSKGETVNSVPVETEDEIGRLALAFNHLAQCLKNREAVNRLLEERLQHSQKMEAIGALTGGIAHDFRNILQTLVLGIKILRGRLARNSVERKLANDVARSSMMARNLTKSLVVFSHKQLTDTRPYDLNEIISRTAQFLTTMVGKKITLLTQLEKSPLVAFVDYGQMEQILMNLATNAKDAMPRGGEIAISTKSVAPGFFKDRGDLDREWTDGGHVLLSFQDKGQGMDQETVKKIFDPFFTTKGLGKGTGLGLSIVYGIIKRNNGLIEVQSEPGQGTTFRIYFPLAMEAAVELEKDESLFPMGGTEGILIAEDDDGVRKVFKDTLENSGYKVTEAKDGDEAVKKFLEVDKDIHLLLFDLTMPGQSGKDAYEKIRMVRPGVKAIFVSGYGENSMQKDFFQCGIPILAKPLYPDELLMKIRETLEADEVF